MKNLIILFVLFFVSNYELQAQDSLNVNVFDSDSLILLDTSIIQPYISLDDLINLYESSLGFVKQQIPCGCEPCATYCFELVPKQPSYEDFIQWLRNF